MNRNNPGIIALLGLAVLAGTGCSLFKGKGDTATGKAAGTAKAPRNITTDISMPQRVPKGKAMMLSVTVQNRSKDNFRFLKWNTPFEKAFLADYLDIRDASGNRVAYRGAMARRVWPPPADAYQTIAAGKAASASIDISKAYTLDKPGTYTLQFAGQNNDDALPASNTLTFKVAE